MVVSMVHRLIKMDWLPWMDKVVLLVDYLPAQVLVDLVLAQRLVVLLLAQADVDLVLLLAQSLILMSSTSFRKSRIVSSSRKLCTTRRDSEMRPRLCFSTQSSTSTIIPKMSLMKDLVRSRSSFEPYRKRLSMSTRIGRRNSLRPSKWRGELSFTEQEERFPISLTRESLRSRVQSPPWLRATYRNCRRVLVMLVVRKSAASAEARRTSSQRVLE